MTNFGYVNNFFTYDFQKSYFITGFQTLKPTITNCERLKAFSALTGKFCSLWLRNPITVYNEDCKVPLRLSFNVFPTASSTLSLFFFMEHILDFATPYSYPLYHFHIFLICWTFHIMLNTVRDHYMVQ